MRHATAGTGVGRDRDRPLTPHGLDEARRVGARLLQAGWMPDRILCSTALRCRQTAQAVRVGLATEVPLELEDALYNASADGLLDALAGFEEDGTLLLIAHNPGVSVLALGLAARSQVRSETSESPLLEGLRQGFAPASFACFDIDGGGAVISARTVRLTGFERASQD